MVEGARLESVFRGNSNVGSNPTLSAILFTHLLCSQLRGTNRKKDEDHRYFSGVENCRVAGGKTAQPTVLYLGERIMTSRQGKHSFCRYI